MKLDATVMRTMSATDFRVLEAVEQGMKNHALVPEKLVAAIANLRHGGAHKIISSLLRDKLLSHEVQRNSYDGYRVTTAGYDILALHNLKKRKIIAALGQRVGTGKESDIYLAATPEGQQVVLKMHRLGRTSFRNVKKKRDYFGKATASAHSWLFLSRLSALKEFAFMKALHDVHYPTPTPIAHNRHIVCMSLVRGLPLYQLYPKQLSVEQSASIYQQAVALSVRLATEHGLVHCDLNEFNLLVDLSGIQALATDNSADPYVRHSGQSVVHSTRSNQTSPTIGMLSKPAWEQSLEAADRIDEYLPEPVERLANGEPKPVVTLIDFPQMISTQHPNAEELYMRDIEGLRRFFTLKLQCQIPDDEVNQVSWKTVMGSMDLTEEQRLDKELKASGFNPAIGQGLELYYFDSTRDRQPHDVSTVVEEEDSDEDEYAEEDEEEDHFEENESSAIDPVQVEEAVDMLPLSGEQAELNCQLDDDLQSSATESQVSSNSKHVVDASLVHSMDHAQLMQHAKERVRRQLAEERKKNRKKGAFRSGNRNKSYVKGKRVLSDAGAW